MTNNKKLFLFTIVPVKSFINDSRKTQDLFGGSALLSRLTHEAIIKAKDVFKTSGFSIITPIYNIKEFDTEKQGIPNRFLAEIDIDAKDIRDKATEIKKAVIDYFVTCENLPKNIQATKQLDNALEIYWVAIDRTDNYKDDFIRINMELAAAKNYKKPVQLNEIGRKCIVDGKRNVVYYRRNSGDGKYKTSEILSKKKLFQPESEVEIFDEGDEKKLKIWHLQEGEGISAVTLRKRLFLNDVHEFPSTAGVALMDLFDEMKKDEDFLKYQQKVNGKNGEKFLNHSDDQLFYYENIAPICKEHGRGDKIKKCQDMHKKWAKKATKPFTKYYALVRFDGDNMGDWFTGVNFNDGTDLMQAQIALSTALGDFSKEINKEIKAPKGKVIYAGGEDFMAFINIHHLDIAVNIILTKFDEIVNKAMANYSDKKITLSMGIAIAHYKQPLSMVLYEAHKMETYVKHNERNGLALSVIKHSGTILSFQYKWSVYKIKPLEHIKEMINLMQNNFFSPAFIIKIYQAFTNYGFGMDRELVKTKIDLYVTQAYIGSTNDKETKISELIEILNDLLKMKYLDNINTSKTPEDKLFMAHRTFGEMLLITDFLFRKTY